MYFGKWRRAVWCKYVIPTFRTFLLPKSPILEAQIKKKGTSISINSEYAILMLKTVYFTADPRFRRFIPS